MADNKTNQVETNLALLNKQEPGAVVLDGEGWAWQNGGDTLRERWYRCIQGRASVSSSELAQRGVITATTTDRTKRKHKRPKGLIHTSKAQYDAHQLLNDLGPGAVVLDCYGDAWQQRPPKKGHYISPEPGYWYGTHHPVDEPLSSYALAFYTPLTPLKPA